MISANVPESLNNEYFQVLTNEFCRKDLHIGLRLVVSTIINKMEHTRMSNIIYYVFKIQIQQMKTHLNTNEASSYAALLPLFAKLQIQANLQDFCQLHAQE